jgi:hypothetical protein
MTRAQAIDQTTAERLLSALAGVRITEKEGYAGAMASWFDRDLRAAIGGTAHFEEALIQALAGGTQAPGARTVTWEGQSYLWDLRASEAARIRRFLARRNAASLDRLLEQQRAGTPDAAGAQRRAEAFDAQLAGALVNIVYAIAWSDPQGAARFDRSLPDRHDLGVSAPTASLRIRTPWAMPRLVFRPAQPWHVEGALLGLEIALAPLRLRAINSSPPRESRVFSTVRASFIGSLGLMNLFALKDGDARAIADAVARGQQRIDAVRSTHDAAGLAGEVRMDGWRARALQWSVVHAPGEVPAHFTMSDRLTLGGGSELLLDARGMSGVEAFACLCTYLRLPGFSAAVVGRPEVGVLATTVPDLNLRVAALLHDLALPAALAPAVLDSALHDLLNDATPVHADDWMSVVRRAGILSRERVEDYVAAVTAAAGPLASHPSTGRLP